jgi:uncharacterized membrane protein YqjE
VSARSPRDEQHPDSAQTIATAIAEVSERATLLVHEEIELAKAEVTEKVTKLLKGTIVGLAAGLFLVLAVLFGLIGCAWLLYYYLPGNDFTYFWGFFAMAVILLVLGAIAGLIAARVVRRSSPPVPDMAIEEARRIRETVSGTGPGEASPGQPAGAPQPAAAAQAAAVPGAPEPSQAAAPPEPAATGNGATTTSDGAPASGAGEEG